MSDLLSSITQENEKKKRRAGSVHGVRTQWPSWAVVNQMGLIFLIALVTRQRASAQLIHKNPAQQPMPELESCPYYINIIGHT